jgi:hypothetical protein
MAKTLIENIRITSIYQTLVAESSYRKFRFIQHMEKLEVKFLKTLITDETAKQYYHDKDKLLKQINRYDEIHKYLCDRFAKYHL